MKLTTAWLQRYLATPIDPRALLDAMPRAALEVEVEVDLADVLREVCVGFVRSKQPIDGAPGMFATRVDLGGRMIDVLASSEYPVEVGHGLPVAIAGTTLPGGRKVTAGRFHGIESAGMICADGEIGLPTAMDATGVRVWTDESLAGRPVADLIAAPGYWAELKVLPNRPDCLGLLGIARELAAIFGTTVVWPDARPLAALAGGKPVAVEIVEPALCPRFTAAPFAGVTVGASPAWLKSVLLAGGMRPINNVVDVTNFVMYETGQPMHAFDLGRLAGRRIVVRKLAAGESLPLLNGRTVTEKYGHPLVVADAERPQALAGIMGGKTAETAAGTTDVLLEVACFDPVHVRGNVKTLRRIDGEGGTDASYRFERGVDPNEMLDYARRRASALLAELAGAKLAAEPTDVYPVPVVPKVMHVSAARITRLIGLPVTDERVRAALTPLGYKVDGSLNVTVPTFRVDVNHEVVIAEDVARMIGFDNIPTHPLTGTATRGLASAADIIRRQAAEFLVQAGWYETKNDPLESAKATASWLGEPPAALVLSNAASAEMAVLRRSLLTGLVASAQRNIFRGEPAVRLFEGDRVFGGEAVQRYQLAGVCGGASLRSSWRGNPAIDLFLVKGLLEDLLESLGVVDVTVRSGERKPYRAGAAGELLAGGKVLGAFGELDTAVLKVDRQPYKLFAFEIEFEALLAARRSGITYRPVNKLPSVQRDLAIVAGEGVTCGAVCDLLHEIGKGPLEAIEVVDEYRGAPIAAGSRSIALRLTFRDPARTLTADEVTAVVNAMIAALADRLGVSIRG